MYKKIYVYLTIPNIKNDTLATKELEYKKSVVPLTT